MGEFKLEYYSKECYDLYSHVHTPQEALDWFKTGHVNQKVINHFRKYITGKVYEIGCNFGVNAIHLSMEPDISQVVAVDYFHKTIDSARLIASHAGASKVEFQVLDFTDPIKEERRFDSVISFHCLEHIYEKDLDIFVENIKTILKPCGCCLISIPYKHAYGSSEHVSFFDEQSLPMLFQKHGFTAISCLYNHEFMTENGDDAPLINCLFINGDSNGMGNDREPDKASATPAC